ncbi:uncharacterized protein L203_102679 [Cryptococcus depauperatus CBS 7841]|uniref:Uncharacterized protein n=1 Tax=Cryptococcus depauperatus CBS 7841 TaxID=1295531 RepID=A0AAJ8M1E4_9TREE
MIRSNPTAIPLRASDLSSLQAEIDRRKTERQDSASSVATAQKEIVFEIVMKDGWPYQHHEIVKNIGHVSRYNY